MDGQAQQLPRLGLLSWENSPVGLNEGDVTYLQGQEDAGATTSELHVYVGHKLRRGNAFDRAGLTDGQQFVVDIHNEAVTNDTEFRTTYGKNNPAPFDLGSDEEVNWDQSGAGQAAESDAKGLGLNRIEDGRCAARGLRREEREGRDRCAVRPGPLRARRNRRGRDHR